MPSTPSQRDVVPRPTPAPLIAELFPGAVAAFCLSGAGDPTQLTVEESQSIEGAARRRCEQFAAGRSCARAALAELGFGPISIPRLEDRRPRWPHGSTGSISHTTGRCVAVAARDDAAGRRLGVDVEQLGRVGPDLERRLFGPEELAELAELTVTGDLALRDRWTTATFGAKEAFYKAQFELTRAWVGFHDVVVSWLGPHTGVWHGSLRPREALEAFEQLHWPVEVAAWFDDGYVISAATVHPSVPG